MATTYVQTNNKSTFLSGVGFAWPLVTTDADIVAAKSGDLIVWNNVCGIALSDYDTNFGHLIVDWAGAYNLEVTAESAAIEVMDLVYYDAAAGKVNDDNTGILVGYALEAIKNGETATIGVKFALGEVE